MEINRKRVARRLVSGLVAGALALGGLAISGGTVSAKTPSTTLKRVQGSDRYSTAIAIANKYVTDSAWANTNLILASGENFPDALAASALSALVDAPIILTKSDSLPSSVRDWLLTKQADFVGPTSGKVYVVGGESAVSQSVVDEVLAAITVATDTAPHTAVRLAGDDRYETAAEINAVSGVVGAADAIVLVSGTSFADALSIAPVAYNEGWPIIPINGALDANAIGTLTTAATLAGGAENVRFLIVGGTSAIPVSVEEGLMGLGAKYENIIRVGGVDRYQTSLLINSGLVLGTLHGAAAFTGTDVALATGDNFPDALAAGPWLGVNGYHLALTNSSGLNPSTAALFATLGKSFASTYANLWAIGGEAAIPATTYAAAKAASQNTNLTPATMICSEGSDKLVMPFTGTLYAGETAGSLVASGEDLAIIAQMSEDGVPMPSTDFDAATPAVFSDLDGDGLLDAIVVILASGASAGTTYAFSGMTESAGGNDRSIGSASCETGTDTTPPVLSVKATQVTSLTDTMFGFIVSANEPIDCSSADVTKIKIDGTALTTETVSQVTKTSCVVEAAGDTGDSVEVLADFVSDATGGTANAAPASTTIAADNGAPSATGSIACVADGQATVVENGVTVTAVSYLDGGTKDGVAGNGYRVKVVAQRGLLIPSVAIDDDAKTITVTADILYHDGGDVARLVANRGLDSDWAFTDSGALAASTTGSLTASGTQVCEVTLVANEVIWDDGAGSLDITNVVVNGLPVSIPAAPAAGALALDEEDLKTVTFTIAPTTAVGSGSVSFTGTLTDIGGKANATFGLAI